MTEEKTSPEPDQKRQKEESQTDLQNPFHLMRVMLRQSVGRIPAGLVIIFMVALALSLVTGAVMQYESIRKQETKNAPRLIPSSVAQTDPALFSGVWASAHKISGKSYVMSLSIVNDRFEWILQDESLSKIRFFARGGWSLSGNVLILRQRKDMGYPGDPDNPSIRYMPIPFDDMEMHFVLNDKGMIWSIPRSEYGQVSASFVFLFDKGSKSTDIVWSRYHN